MGQTAAILAESTAQARAARLSGRLEAKASAAEARIAELQAQDALRRGQEEAQRFLTETRQVVGAQRAGFAAQGVEVGAGTAGALEEQTRVLGEIDAATIRSNAYREAFGYRVQATRARAEAAFARAAGRATAATTLLTGGFKAAAKGIEEYSGFFPPAPEKKEEKKG